MRRIILIICVLIPVELVSQDIVYRREYPLAAKIGFQGVGLDLALGDRFGIDATTWIVSYNINARCYLLDKNGSPYIGAGIGKFNGFGGSGGNQYSVGFIGWEHSYEVFMIQIVAQSTLNKKNSNDYTPFVVNLNIGIRIH